MPQESWQFNAFPSGHTAAAFGVATMLALLTRGTKYRRVGQVGLVWATLVGISRIYRGVHWPTDVLGGALAGGLGALIVYAVAEQFLPEVAEHEHATLED
jgi:undecaprenyl-diphosphatase